MRRLEPLTPMRRRRSRSGLTLVELIVAFTIMLLLTTMAVPLARSKVRRNKEREYRLAKREILTAIDKFKDAVDAQKIPMPKLESNGYPETLDSLVEGVKGTGTNADTKVKFLRRIPKDPFTNTTDWGKRSMQDDPKSGGWGGQNVFDVFTKSNERAADGTSYSEW